jgi:hypothetical protein
MLLDAYLGCVAEDLQGSNSSSLARSVATFGHFGVDTEG